ncbi:MAG: SigE family RNA polymerase sigma factor [Ilumatobacteraceae bacterium]
MLINPELNQQAGQVAVAASFDRFYAATVRRTLALAFALTGNWGDAEDLVQDAFGAAHRRWAQVSAYDDPAAWVRRIVLNRSVSRWRRLQREALAVVRLGSRIGAGRDDTDPVDPAFWAAVGRLPPKQARAVALFYIDDLSVEQIAGELGCSAGSVKTHLSRARAALARQLAMQQEDHDHG